MKIFQDVFSGAELLSDSYKIDMIFEDVVGQVKSRMIVKKEGEVDIGCGNAFGGNNQDEQQGGNSGEAPPEKVIDLVDAFQYQQTSFDLKGFGDYFKGYMKKLLEYLEKNQPARVDKFKEGAKAFFGFVKSRFGDFSFYTPSDYDMQNLIVLSYYKNEEDDAPTFLYIMDGFKTYKV